jgi:hypothetical protein
LQVSLALAYGTRGDGIRAWLLIDGLKLLLLDFSSIMGLCG